MNIVEISHSIITRKTFSSAPLKIRRASFEPGEYINVHDEYLDFTVKGYLVKGYLVGEYIEWYPSLGDLIATDWEFINE